MCPYLKKFLDKITSSVYIEFFPVKNPDGKFYVPLHSAKYLNDLWRSSFKKNAFIQTSILIIFCTMPIFKWDCIRPFFLLNHDKKISFIESCFYSRYYFIRMVVYAVKTQSIFSSLQDPIIRQYIEKVHIK